MSADDGSDEDNWYEKDEDELLQQLQPKLKEREMKENVEVIETPKEECKNIIKIHGQSNIYGKKRIETHTLSKLVAKDPLDLFLYVSTKTDDPFDVYLADQIVETDPQSRVVLYVQLLGILYEMKLQGFMEEIVSLFSNNDNLMSLLSLHVTRIFDKRFLSLWQDVQIIEQFIGNIKLLLLQTYHLKFLTQKGYSLLETLRKAVTNCNRSDLREALFFKELEKDLLHIFHEKNDSRVDIIGKDILPNLEDLLVANEMSNVDAECRNADNQCSVQLYILKQMKQLREDFMSSLHDCVRELRHSHQLPPSSDQTLWRDVQIVLNREFLKANRNEMLFVDVIASKRTPQSRISYEKQTALSKIKTGALLCFTTDFNFDNLIVATVTYTCPKVLTQGFIGIEIRSQYYIGNIYGKNFIMFETPAFFEPYHNTYNYLRNCSINDFPMQKYIIRGEKNIEKPNYLRNTTVFSLKKQEWKLNEDVPRSVKLDLDGSQLEAFKYALNNEFCLIQGPPGTGKTHVSIEIVKTLLENIHTINKVETPIIIITYTNESLDKFLLKLSENSEINILRCGSQTRLPEIKKYNEAFADVSNMCNPHLRKLYFAVKSDYILKFETLKNLQERFDGTDANYQIMLKAQQELHLVRNKLETIRIMFQYYSAKSKSIIAMTTTCASKMNSLFRFLKSPIVIFEEAAEIQESHIISCLTPFTQHVLMIGDHMQLQPYTSSFLYSKACGLNISLFERLIKENFQYKTLNVQYRMRPIIAELLTPIFYKTLNNSNDVFRYPSIKGLQKNLFFLNHSNEESKHKDEGSISNSAELRLLVRLAEHLMNCGYSSNDIVILSPYAKQIANFQNDMVISKYGIRASTVDSFQGLEAQIVLLSLVRNNSRGDIGFLKQKNRICVALSRAKLGLYIAGNIDLLAQKSSAWLSIKRKLEANHCIGPEFPICLEDVLEGLLLHSL